MPSSRSKHTYRLAFFLISLWLDDIFFLWFRRHIFGQDFLFDLTHRLKPLQVRQYVGRSGKCHVTDFEVTVLSIVFFWDGGNIQVKNGKKPCFFFFFFGLVKRLKRETPTKIWVKKRDWDSEIRQKIWGWSFFTTRLSHRGFRVFLQALVDWHHGIFQTAGGRPKRPEKIPLVLEFLKRKTERWWFFFGVFQSLVFFLGGDYNKLPCGIGILWKH